MAWIHRFVIGVACFLGPLTLAAGASASELTEVSFRTAKYSFKASVEDGGEPQDVELSYPVLVNGNPASIKRINTWLRKTALATFFSGDDEALLQALKNTDRRVIKELAEGTGGILQSVLSPSSALGHIRTFTLNMSTLGRARSHQGLAVYAFNLRSGKPIAIESLFHPDASADLADLFDTAKTKGFPSCNERNFDWSYVNILNHHQISLNFPYHPAEFNECGDGFYLLSGRRIKALLKNRKDLMPEYKYIEIR